MKLRNGVIKNQIENMKEKDMKNSNKVFQKREYVNAIRPTKFILLQEGCILYLLRAPA